MRILFVYNNVLDGSFGGSQRTIQNLNGLKQFAEVELLKFEKINKLHTLMNSLLGYLGNSSIKYKKILERKIKEIKYDYVFFDQTIHGKLVKYISKKYKQKCIVHYHNNDSDYYHDLFKTQGVKFLSIYLAARYNQNCSRKYAYRNVFITKEDSISVGKTSNEKVIIPITLNDKFIENEIITTNEPYILYVGSASYANIEGAKYIIEKIADKTSLKFFLVGKGLKKELDNRRIKYPDNVLVMDYVENLSACYKNACAFISPLLYGSGMKVKLAEALMYGKYIIGSPLSFWGYETIEASDICYSVEDYIKAINKLDNHKVFYKSNREIFCKNYSSICDERYFGMLFE